jgi:hypothetical protein
LIRRRPVAAYRVIDEQELLSGDDGAGGGWTDAPPDWAAAEDLHVGRPRSARWRRAAVVGAAVVVVAAFALRDLATPPRPTAAPRALGAKATTLVGAATTLESRTPPRRTARRSLPPATVMTRPRGEVARRRPQRLRSRPRPRRRHARRNAELVRRAARRAVRPAPPAPATPVTPATSAPPSPAAEFGFER